MSEYPSDWRVTDLGAVVAEIVAGQSPNRMEHPARNGKKGILKTTAIQWSGFSPLENLEALPDFTANSNTIVRKNDILITKAGPSHRVGVVALSNEDTETLHVSGKMAAIRTSEDVDPKFLAYQMSHDAFQMQLRSDITGMALSQTNITHENLLAKSIVVPPLPEQKKIAEILSGIDRAIDSIIRATERLTLLKKSLSLKLLGTQGAQYRQSKFGDVCIKVQDGTHFSPQSKDGDHLYITSKNIRPGRLDLSSVAWISTEEHNSIYKRCQVKKGDILLTKDGANTGNACLNTLDEEFSLLSSVAFLRPDPSICETNYMLQWIMSDAFQNAIKQEMSGNAISRLTLTKINNLSISLPPLEMQREIAGILQSLDNQRMSYESKTDSLSGLKNALSSDLLSGRKRVSI